MMLIRRRPVPLVSGKKRRFKEESNDHLKSLLPGLNLGGNEKKKSQTQSEVQGLPAMLGRNRRDITMHTGHIHWFKNDPDHENTVKANKLST